MAEATKKRNIHQRLLSAMGKVSYVQKEKKSGMQYSIVSHDSVTALIRPILVEEGIVYYPVNLDWSQDGNRTQVALVVRFVNADDPEDSIDVPALGFGIDSQDKGPGKAVSYAVKYALLKTLNLETGDDPDKDQNVTHEKAPERNGVKTVGDAVPDKHPKTGEEYQIVYWTDRTRSYNRSGTPLEAGLRYEIEQDAKGVLTKAIEVK